jgi:hypothetical protein
LGSRETHGGRWKEAEKEERKRKRKLWPVRRLEVKRRYERRQEGGEERRGGGRKVEILGGG